MTKEVNFPSGYKKLVKLTSRYAKLIRASIPTRMDTSTGEVNMMGTNYAMNGSDKSTRKVDLKKVPKELTIGLTRENQLV
jgi:hypothetical protein